MPPISLTKLKQLKQEAKKFACITAYDASFAHICEQAGIETILVGDSLGNVLQGHGSTLPVSIDDMAYHVQCVASGTNACFIIGDLSFMSYATVEQGLVSATRIMQAGAHMVKMEGGAWLTPLIEALAERGVPVCGHLGLTPQSVNKLGGYKVQGRDSVAADHMLKDALALEAAGAELIVLECVPTSLAETITKALKIPTIGIGAGNVTDAQVLVLHDMLGLNPKPAKFVKNFMADADSILDAIKNYGDETRSGSFPSNDYSFN